MYGWIWRKLPLGLWGKISGSVLLLGVATALLWFVIFPWAEPLLPFDDVQVGNPDSSEVVPGDGTGDEFQAPDPSASYGDEYDNPYDTGEGSPSPRPTRR